VGIGEFVHAFMKVIYIAIMKYDRFLDDEGNIEEAYEAQW